MTLDLTALRNAVSQLNDLLELCDSDLAKSNAKITRAFRTAAIQAFVFTYEQSWKMLRRCLQIASASAESIGEMAFPDLIRTGSEQALLRSGWDVWKDYRRLRNMTSHV